jgi:hypothetical protein
VQLAMVNIQSQLGEKVNSAKYNFRVPRSFAGAGLYTNLDGVRMVLQV